MVLDNLDRRLLGLLQEDARRSHRELARLAGSTAPTVGARIRRMEGLGIIQGYTVRLGSERFGGPVDLAGDVHVDCHECGRRTARPEWATLATRHHPFCCPTCKATFVARHERLAQGV